ncbi:hypothetical protein ACE193_12475 [Bernardetia sp. OM2101]|uniref:hypothetical protein n=1 Tax=Bernardetia sp. OM2101 TaxID=3344876 RepID=UPI0035CE9B0B
MKEFKKFRISTKEASNISGGTRKPRVVKEPTAEFCSSQGMGHCHSTTTGRDYCCRG